MEIFIWMYLKFASIVFFRVIRINDWKTYGSEIYVEIDIDSAVFFIVETKVSGRFGVYSMGNLWYKMEID